MRKRPIDPSHESKRNALRVLGPVVLVLGLLFVVVGVADFFMSVLGDGEAPRLFWCVFVGMPLLFVGTVMTGAGFIGAVARYQAGEYAPVAEDTFNYMAEGTRDGVRTVASAIGEGLRGERGAGAVDCPACGAENEAGSRFCDQCGEKLPGDVTCAGCGSVNDAEARFCDGCGQRLGDG